MADKALSGTRVLEYAQFVSGPYCTKLMADLGAEVIKIEPPEGDIARKRGPFPGDIPHPERSGLFLYNNTNKLGVTLDLNSTEDKETFKRLIENTDVFIEDTSPGTMKSLGLDFSTLKKINPRLVMTSITPFGQTGPYNNYKAYYLNLSHGSGLSYSCPFQPLDPHILEREPVREGGLIAEYDCGISAAIATLSALYLCQYTGTGQYIDVSKQEALLHLIRPEMAMYFVSGHRDHRADRDMPSSWAGVHLCKDGYMLIFFIDDKAWHSFVDLTGNPEWANDENLGIAEKRRELHSEGVHPLIRPWTAEHTREEIFHGLQKHGCPAAILYKVGEVPNTEHMKARDFFVAIDHPESGKLSYPSGLAKFSKTPTAFQRPAPLLGQHNEDIRGDEPSGIPQLSPQVKSDGVRPRTGNGLLNRKPLEGVRIADLCWVWAGPSGTELLAYLGAEVIRVESQSHICLTRWITPWLWLPTPDINQCLAYNSLNFNKKSITINLTQPKGIELLKRLIAVSDVVTDNYSGGTMERFGLTYSELKKIKPDIIALSMSGWGAYGPERDYRAYDPVFPALSGLNDLTGYPDSQPCALLSANSGRFDLTNGTALAFCVMAALIHRARTGEGQFIDISQWEVANCVIGDTFMDYFMNQRNPNRMGNRDNFVAPHNCYRCKGGDKWVSIAITTDEEWQAFCLTVGKPEWISDPRFADATSRWKNQEEIDNLISQWTINHTHYDVTEILQRAGVAAFPSMSREELAHDPHLIERGAFVEVEHPEAGRQTFLTPPWKLSATPAEITKHSPLLGEDNEYVFCDLLGMPVEEFATLVGEGIIY